MTALDTALDYARMGLFVFPCNGKQPLVQWGTESTTNPETVRKWWTQWPSAGIGVDCGKSGLVVIDLDVKNNADGPTNWRQRLNGHPIPATFNVRTPSGGWHGWYRDPTGRYRNSASLIAPGVDVRAVGGYVLAPGSPGYRWYGETPLGLGDVPIMPDGIIPAPATTGTGHWATLDKDTLNPLDRVALEALETLGGHGACQTGDYISITRPHKLAGASASIGHIMPGVVRVFTSNWPKLNEGVYDADQLVALAGGEQTGNKFDEYYLPRSVLAHLPRGDSLIDGVIDRHSLFVIAGRDQSYKSFLALDWLLCIATGHPWLGREVQRGRVLYIVGEGAWGLNDRVTAWEAAWRQPVDDDWFHVRRAPVNLFRGGDAYTDLLARIVSQHYDVVIFDTLQRMASGADQNAAKDAGVIITHLDRIRHATGNGAVGVVAHTDKSDNDTRGSSAFEDDSDIVWRIKYNSDDNIIRALLDKRKDGPSGTAIELRPLLIAGTDSLVLEHAGRPSWETRRAPAQALPILAELAKPIFEDVGAASSALADTLGLKGKSSVNAALNYLLEAGFIEKSVHGRIRRYKINPLGASILVQNEDNALTSANANASNASTISPNVSNASVQPSGSSKTQKVDASEAWTDGRNCSKCNQPLLNTKSIALGTCARCRQENP